MESTIPTFGAREFVAIIVTLAAIVAFLLSSIKLTLSTRRDGVNLGVNAGQGGLQLTTQNLSIVTLCVSGVLLAVMGTAAFASDDERWVYLGPGYGNHKWNFLAVDGSRNFSAGDVVVANNRVNIREAAFGNFTQTWLGFLSRPEPKITGHLKAGSCARVLGFTSVGLNKVWMKIEKARCPVALNG